MPTQRVAMKVALSFWPGAGVWIGVWNGVWIGVGSPIVVLSMMTELGAGVGQKILCAMSTIRMNAADDILIFSNSICKKNHN